MGHGFRGTLDITPVDGNCVTEPVTKVRINAEFFFSESFFTES